MLVMAFSKNPKKFIMKDLLDKQAYDELIDRINKLQPDSQRLWGKMDVAQMLAHCSAAMEVAVGNKFPPRIFIGRILAPFFKKAFFGPQPFKKNSPTDKSFLVIDRRNFEKEKARLLSLLHQFHAGGEEKVTRHPHSFFGKLTPKQWSIGMYKHMDHHLKQFGV